MIDLTSNPTPVQRTARRLLLVVCSILSIGLIGAVVVKGDDADPEARFVHETEQLEADLDAEVQLASSQIQPDFTPVNDGAGAGAAPAPAAPPAQEMLSTRVLWMEVTAYCPCVRCCGDDSPGITASGKPVSYNNGRFVAADTSLLPFGTQLQIPGYAGGEPVEVIDRGGAIKGHRLDLYFDSHQEALEWGRQWVAVTVLQ